MRSRSGNTSYVASVAAMAMAVFWPILNPAVPVNALPAAPGIVHPAKAPTDQTTRALIEQAQARAHASDDVARMYGGGCQGCEGNPDISHAPNDRATAAAKAADEADTTKTAAKAAADAADAAVEAVEQNSYQFQAHAPEKYEKLHDAATAAAKAAKAAAEKPDDVTLANKAAVAQNNLTTVAETSTEEIQEVKG
ncbi:hypothetical protein [Nocardia brasiliensis]|uniref:hypothetical protein n=1 Tax=Nocardia brasiliensis TaxID=37326 RepID=UPI0018940AF4|nr:hypothetical protein [Nocardia brasiliensis]MBF6545641.1 hypothetical protein [Nocardia brasiliensis]